MAGLNINQANICTRLGGCQATFGIINLGLQEIGDLTKTYYSKYHPYGAGMADIIQLGAIVGKESEITAQEGPDVFVADVLRSDIASLLQVLRE